MDGIDCSKNSVKYSRCWCSEWCSLRHHRYTMNKFYVEYIRLIYENNISTMVKYLFGLQVQDSSDSTNNLSKSNDIVNSTFTNLILRFQHNIWHNSIQTCILCIHDASKCKRRRCEGVERRERTTCHKRRCTKLCVRVRVSLQRTMYYESWNSSSEQRYRVSALLTALCRRRVTDIYIV